MAKRSSKKPNKPNKPSRNKKSSRKSSSKSSRPPRKNREAFGNSNKTDSGQGGTFTLQIRDIANGGYALGKHNRRTVLIPYAIPGEKLRARITHSARSVDFAEGVQLLESSADRVYSECEHFGAGACWGCQWQHIDYRAQQLLKQDILLDQVQRFGKLSDSALKRAFVEIIASPVVWQYSYQMRLERITSAVGMAQWGMPRMDGRSLEPISTCLIMRPELQNLYESLEFDLPNVKQLHLLLGSDGATMLNMTLDDEDAPELSADFATSVNIILPDNEPVNLVGDSYITYRVGERDFRLTAGGFFRAHVAQMDALIGEVLGALQLKGDERVLDLYAGTGVFSAFLAPRAELVTLVESYPPLATDADANLADYDSVDVIEGSVEAVLSSLQDAEENYDVALVDPPSNGMSDSAKQTLIQMGVKHIAYVSSNPATLGADIQDFMKAGYKLKRLQPFDFAPHTYYVEGFALLEKA
jgi:23S rRNA (uracil1939-C5)-methyltransferase